MPRPRPPSRGARVWQALLARVLLAIMVLVLVLAGPVGVRAAEPAARVVDLPLADGGAVRLLVEAPAAPRAVLILLPGGTGMVGIGDDGRLRHGANVLIRIRADLIARGFGVILPDAAPPGLRGHRASAAYAGTLAANLAYARTTFGRPVFFMGTSQGAIAAVAGAARGPRDGLAGIILSEPVTRAGRSPETVFDAHPQDVRVPVLIVSNGDDRCRVAPPADAGRLARSLVHSPAVEVARLSGGEGRGRPCGSLSPHGYLGIEPAFLASVARWLDGRLAAKP